MLRISLFSLILFSFFGSLSCQQSRVPERLTTSYAPLNKKLAKTIAADELAINPTEAKTIQQAIFLDAREKAEYQVSHLPGALMIGYEKPDFSILDGLDKDRPVVVYCTIGYRSERMAKQLRDRGFAEVYNLYGSIYAWRLAGFSLEDMNGKTTEKVHTYNKKWSDYFPDDANEVY